jgi:ubiquitin-like-conjugating enzyme ATG10
MASVVGACWTDTRWSQTCNRLVDVLEHYLLSRQNCNESQSRKAPRDMLCHWQVASTMGDTNATVTLNDGGVYLFHPMVRCVHDAPTVPSATPHTVSQDPNNSDNIQSSNDVNNDMEVEDLWEDPDRATSAHHGTACTTSSSSTHHGSEWRISTVYSPTFACPVLYFTVQSSDDGTPWTRRQVVDYLQSLQHERHDSFDSCDASDRREDKAITGEWISMEEHPITGTPAYFLHPCRTQERLQLLMSPDDQDNDALVVWAWMALVVPTIGWSIEPATYHQVWHLLRSTAT